jgi:UDP-N-acetylglucosamine 2-epimerase (non-hydrolysing)
MSKAGLRTGDSMNPFPEEMNRKVAGILARWHFAPTQVSRANLLAEGTPDASIHVTGNTVIDALLDIAPARQRHRRAARRRHTAWCLSPRIAARTSARRWTKPAARSARWRCAHRCAVPVPRASQSQRAAARWTRGSATTRASSWSNRWTTARSWPRCAARPWCSPTPAGVQEEAPALGKPVLVPARGNRAPRGRGRKASWPWWAATSTASSPPVNRLLDDPAAHAAMARKGVSPYGDGHARERFVALLARDMVTKRIARLRPGAAGG